MAKRELIDREQVITEIKYMDNNGFITRTVNHVCEDIRMIPAITEQEIVKPYLDKIRAEIKKSSHGKWYVGRIDGKTEEVLLLDEVMQILDKYKAESEGV